MLPGTAAANILGIFLGTTNYAAADTEDGTPSTQNSQNMDLLEANVSSVAMLPDKKGGKDPVIDESTDVSIVGENALLPSAGPVDTSIGADGDFSFDDQTSVYVVRKGDTVAQVAEMFGVSSDTILAANNMKKGDKLSEGDVLVILPISGIEHKVVKGDTLQSIAKHYKVDVDDIIAYNDIPAGKALSIGDELLIPGGSMADEGGDKPAANLGTAVARDANYYKLHPIKNLVGYFINPLPTGHKTQGLHGPGHAGIDIGAPKGTPIYAAASGTVLSAKMGWNGGYGNFVLIQHPNGTQTLYAHMTALGTHSGASVSQGEVIGFVGSTGHSTGPHLHFEVHGAKNPGSDWSWAH